MTKNTINQICDKLTALADNFAEQERILRGLIAVIRAAKDEKTEKPVTNELPNDMLGNIEKLLKELLEQKEGGKSSTSPVKWPYDTHPHIRPYAGDQPGWWQDQPHAIYQSSRPELWPNQPPVNLNGASVSILQDCSSPSNQKIIYADPNGTHIVDNKGAQ